MLIGQNAFYVLSIGVAYSGSYTLDSIDSIIPWSYWCIYLKIYIYIGNNFCSIINKNDFILYIIVITDIIIPRGIRSARKYWSILNVIILYNHYTVLLMRVKEKCLHMGIKMSKREEKDVSFLAYFYCCSFDAYHRYQVCNETQCPRCLAMSEWTCHLTHTLWPEERLRSTE